MSQFFVFFRLVKQSLEKFLYHHIDTHHSKTTGWKYLHLL